MILYIMYLYIYIHSSLINLTTHILPFFNALLNVLNDSQLIALLKVLEQLGFSFLAYIVINNILITI